MKKNLNHIKNILKEKPKAALILGSGWGTAIKYLKQKDWEIPYHQIEGFVQTQVKGHEGKLYSFYNGQLLVFSGRFHGYEGYQYQQLCIPAHFAVELGVSNVIITNAAGGINPRFSIGDVILIDGFIIPTPISLSIPIKIIPQQYQLFTSVAQQQKHYLARKKIIISCGCYTFVCGPSYESKAEISFFQKIGGDLVGMSTFPEVTWLIHHRTNVIALSLISNMATGILPKLLNHEEIKQTVEDNQNYLYHILATLLKQWGIKIPSI